MRRSLVVAGVLVLLAATFAAAAALLTSPATRAPDPDTRGNTTMFRLDGYESGIYPFLNKKPSFAPYSPVNLVVRGPTDEVVRALTERSDTQWNRTTANASDASEGGFRTREINVTGTRIDWDPAGGATRYAYVETGANGTEGAWVRETDQLHAGTYFGHRLHVRLYESPNASEPWVAGQAHTEHFDWFTLRHAVDGTEDAQRQIEDEMMGEPWVDRVYREFLANDGPSDADGWATIVELALALPVALVGMTRGLGPLYDRLSPVDRHRVRALLERLGPRHAVLPAAIAGLVFAVRGGGIALELTTRLGPYPIASALYPVLALGVPVVAYAVASGMRRRMDAAVLASGALGAAFLVDYAAIGVDALPVGLLVHRVGLVLAIGLFAGGAARRATRTSRFNDLVLGGAMLWVGLLVAALGGWV